MVSIIGCPWQNLERRLRVKQATTTTCRKVRRNPSVIEHNCGFFGDTSLLLECSDTSNIVGKRVDPPYAVLSTMIGNHQVVLREIGLRYRVSTPLGITSKAKHSNLPNHRNIRFVRLPRVSLFFVVDLMLSAKSRRELFDQPSLDGSWASRIYIHSKNLPSPVRLGIV